MRYSEICKNTFEAHWLYLLWDHFAPKRLQTICRPADDLPMMKKEMAGLYALDSVTEDEKTYNNNL